MPAVRAAPVALVFEAVPVLAPVLDLDLLVDPAGGALSALPGMGDAAVGGGLEPDIWAALMYGRAQRAAAAAIAMGSFGMVASLLDGPPTSPQQV
jgi:hypothetical protein